MMVEMICAGFGGQGVLTTGLILAEAGMKLGMNVLWYPSYGSEMRGGTANCTVKFSDKEIASPCAKKIDILMGMNAPAIDKFESSLRPGGLLLVNSSLVHEREYRDDIRVVKVPMTEIAAEHENPRGANIVMIGAIIKILGKSWTLSAVTAGFVVALTGDILTMPGLPASPAAERIDVTPDGRITGLF